MSMPEMVTVAYDLNDAFLEALEESRPNLVKYLREQGVVRCKLTSVKPPARSYRHLLAFQGLPRELPKSVEFELDRQIDNDEPCLVLSHHPDTLIEMDKTLASIAAEPLPRDFTYPLDVYVASDRLASMDLPVEASLLTKCKLVGREAFMLKLELPSGLAFTLDHDDVAAFGGVWVVRDGVNMEPLKLPNLP